MGDTFKFQPPPGAVVTKEKTDEVDAQVERIDKIFKRQLRVPLQGKQPLVKASWML